MRPHFPHRTELDWGLLPAGRSWIQQDLDRPEACRDCFEATEDQMTIANHVRAMMKGSCFLSVIVACVLAGCSSTPKTYSTVLEGMSRNVLRSYFGEPLRVEPGASGGEVWYYSFSTWQTQPTGSSGVSEEFGERTTYVSAGLEFSKQVEEMPVRISPEGFVVPPLPRGKVLKN
jgi:outer membrane protein assembly factor BamE (lipoprotein component of BamABCDE complex)